MTIEACAERVHRGDPDRFRTAMVAPPERRPGLFALYAFNLEIARAPWAASEPGLAAIRLRWWSDTVAEIAAGAPPRRHEVAGPLAEAIRAAGLPEPVFAAMIAARAGDADPAPHPDRAALERYIDATAGGLMELAARHLGAGGEALPVVREFARGAGAAALLLARPELRARSRDPFPPGLDVAAFAGDARAAALRARSRRALVPPPALAALLPGRLAATILARAAADPGAVLRGELAVSEFRARASLVARAFTGRW